MSLFKLKRRSASIVPCDPALIYDVLTDYDAYAEWAPCVAASRLLAREGDLAIAEFELVRTGQEKLVVECIHTPNKMVLYRAIGGTLPISRVEWTIEPADGGRSRVILAIEAGMSRRWLRPAYRRVIDPAQHFRGLQDQISAFLPEEAAGEDGEKILEIVETGEGIVCWIRGKKYILTPAP